MKNKKLTVGIGISVMILGLGVVFIRTCAKPNEPVVISDLPGTYHSQWSSPYHGDETLILNAEGSFRQEHKSVKGKILSNLGTWQTDGVDQYGVRSIVLRGYREFSRAGDEDLAKLGIAFKVSTNAQFGVERLSERKIPFRKSSQPDEIALFFGPDTGDRYVKQISPTEVP